MSTSFNQEDFRRELDEAYIRAEAIVLADTAEGNPYLATMLDLMGEEALYAGWLNSSWSTGAHYARRRLTPHYAWAIPDERALELVGATGRVVEVGAGGGYWAALLRARGVEVHAYDRAPAGTHYSEKLWTEVLPGRTKPVERHADSTLFLCWPPYAERFGEIALRRYLRAGGQRVAYVGEGSGGCCADDAFFELLEAEMTEIESHSIPQFPGIHDYLTIWERKA